MPRRAKVAASAMMLASAAVPVLARPAPLAVKIGVPLLMAAVALWLWLRPEQ